MNECGTHKPWNSANFPQPIFRAQLLVVVFLLTCASSTFAQEAVSEPVIVRADRLPDAETSAPFDVHLLDRADLENAPQLRLDDILRAEIPGFSLFRRSSSRTANPTTQGVTLRNFGPSGAGRTLVLLDGIPVNDPFAGYVLWSQVPTDSLDSVIVQPGGGAGLFGNAALGGTIFLLSRPMTTDAAEAEASIGSDNTYEGSIDGTVMGKTMAASLFAEGFSTSGYPVIRADQRGPVDNTASADSDLVQFRSQWQISQDNSLQLSVRHFDDERGNGTTYTQNNSHGTDASAVLTLGFPAETAQLQLSAYGQHRNFNSTFSSINDARDVETPAQDQFDVPADAVGGSVVWSMTLAESHKLTLGIDSRWVEGETNEDYLWDGSEFTKLRNAGGKQIFLGFFAEDTWSVSPRLTLVGGLRYDHWKLFDGFRKESSLQNGSVSLGSHFPDRSGDEINGRVGAQFRPVKEIALRGAFYTGFRVPTLNELYRPFRVGNDITEANPGLKPECLLGGEAGMDWQVTPEIQLSATGFANWLENAVGNITIGHGPGTFNPGGFVPEGATLRQRKNVDLVIAPGFEVTAAWHVVPELSLKASYLFTHPTIQRASDPTLEGKLLAQTPENVFTGTVEWMPTAKWSFMVQGHYTDRQFEDDQNQRVLAPYITLDAALVYAFSPHFSASIRAENLFNEEIETGKSATGLVSIGTPRSIGFQLRWQL